MPKTVLARKKAVKTLFYSLTILFLIYLF